MSMAREDDQEGGIVGKDAPDPPNYAAAAAQQGESNVEALRLGTRLDRPYQYTPWGSIEWAEDRGSDLWTQRMNLSPRLQEALTAQQTIDLTKSYMAQEALGHAGAMLPGGTMWDPLSANEVLMGDAERERAEGAIYQSQANRLDPQWNQRQSALEVQLHNQGLAPGDEAYTAAMGDFNRARNDAYQQASLAAIAGGGTEAERRFNMDRIRRQQAFSELLQNRGWTINEVNAILTGAQVQQPTFPGFVASGAPAPAPYFNAAQAQYGADIDAFNAQQAGWQGLFSGLGSVFTAGAGLF